MTDILFLNAADQLQLLSSGKVSARELLEMSVFRADQLNLSLNAIVSRDLDRAFADALSVDDRRGRNEPLGRLAGLPMTVKDALDVKGLPASAGLKDLLNRSATDAVPVHRVRVQDAIIWGKTNTPVKAGDWQTYNGLYGTTNNPWDQKRTPGGSSGGSAAAVAAGLTALEIGADIAGSLRIPAGFCGVFAHKPTYGLVSQRGLVPPPDFAADLDMAVVGPIARSAQDLRLLLSIIAKKPISSDPSLVQLNGLKVALWIDEPAFALDREVRKATEVFAGRLAAAGAVVETITSPVDVETLILTYTMLLYPVVNADLPMGERSLYELLRGPAMIARSLGAKPLSWAQGILGATARHREWLQANERRARMQQTLQTFFSSYDILLTPISPTVAFAHDHGPFLKRKIRCSDGRNISYLEMMNWIALATVCGLPVTVVPIGLTHQNLPVGVQLIGPSGGDERTLAVAQAIEEQIGGFRSPPLP